MSAAAAGRVLRLSVLAWGLGLLAMGRRGAGLGWLAAEGISLVLVIVATVALAGTTWYLVPFLAGMAFIGAWCLQAILAFRAAQRLDGATESAARRSPAAGIAWLTLPLLVWGTGFWLVGADASNPAAVVDQFIGTWPDVGTPTEAKLPITLAEDPAEVQAAAAGALDSLRQLCDAGELAADCADSTEALLRDLRFEVSQTGPDSALATAEVVRYEPRASRFLWLFETTELVPVPTRPVLELQLASRGAALGSSRWVIVNATPLAAVRLV